MNLKSLKVLSSDLVDGYGCAMGMFCLCFCFGTERGTIIFAMAIGTTISWAGCTDQCPVCLSLMSMI